MKRIDGAFEIPQFSADVTNLRLGELSGDITGTLIARLKEGSVEVGFVTFSADQRSWSCKPIHAPARTGEYKNTFGKGIFGQIAAHLQSQFPFGPMYRALTINRVARYADKIDFGFQESCVSLVVPLNWFVGKSISPLQIVEGARIWLKGTRGNQDCVLASPNSVADLRMAP